MEGGGGSLGVAEEVHNSDDVHLISWSACWVEPGNGRRRRHFPVFAGCRSVKLRLREREWCKLGVVHTCLHVRARVEERKRACEDLVPHRHLLHAELTTFFSTEPRNIILAMRFQFQ